MTKALRISFWAILGLCLSVFLRPQHALAQSPSFNEESSAVILTYHRVGEDAYPDTNIRIDQFLAQIEELENGEYTVLPLPKVIAALKTNSTLPEKTVVITFEGAFRSALKNAMPVLLTKQMPFTVFFSSDLADGDTGQNMDWADLRRLAKSDLVTLGIHPASYTRLAGEDSGKMLEQINKARLHYRKNFGKEPEFFSYPFGEYSLPYRDLIEKQGFEAAFSLNSGTASGNADFFALPRFTMTENYGDLERFKLVTSALPFPVDDIEPKDPYLQESQPSIGFSVADPLVQNLNALSCYVSGQTNTGIEILGKNRIQLKLSDALPEGRTRVNCTLPLPQNNDETPRWRWFGMLLVKGNDDTAEN